MKKFLIFTAVAGGLLLSGARGIEADHGTETSPKAETPKNIDALPPVPSGQSWAVTFQDEFNGTAVDESKWMIREGKRNDAMRSRRAVSLDGKGVLKMSIFKDGNAFLNSWIDTEGKFQQAYGYWVARMKMQKSKGHWIAFWLQTPTTPHVDGSGRDGSEIDIMEKFWLDDRVNHAIHWDGYAKAHRYEHFRSVTPGVMEGWHTFAVLWSPQEYIFYVDAREVWRSKSGGVCQVPAHLRVTDEARIFVSPKSEVGSVRDAILPDSFSVDYVRVYQLVGSDGKPVWTPPAQPEPAAVQ